MFNLFNKKKVFAGKQNNDEKSPLLLRQEPKRTRTMQSPLRLPHWAKPGPSSIKWTANKPIPGGPWP